MYNLGDNCIQNFHLGSYIVGYMVGNLVLWRPASRAVKRDFRTYTWVVPVNRGLLLYLETV